MTSSTSQTTTSGDNSITVQAETLNIGVSYSEAKEIALEVFNSNFHKLSQVAATIATERAEKITGEFINRLMNEKLESLEAIKDPGFQYTLYEAQKSYAKTGDDITKDVLVDILIDRIVNQERDLKQIVLDESINVVGKLTSPQLDTLTIIFLLKYTVDNGIISFDKLKEYFDVKIMPFTEHLSKELSLYQHLEFTGCGNMSIGHLPFIDCFKNDYAGLFFIGFRQDDFEEKIGPINEFNDLLIACLNDGAKLQLNALNNTTLDSKMVNLKLNVDVSKKLRNLFGEFMLSDNAIKDKLLYLGGSNIINLFEIRENSNIKNMTLTSVGLAIGNANYKRKTGIKLDLGIWIK